MSGPRRFVVPKQFRRAAEERISPKWTIVDAGSAAKYSFVVKTGHPNMQSVIVDAFIDRYTSLDEVADFIEAFVNQMLPESTFQIYAMRGYPRGGVIPLEGAKVTLRPYVGWPESAYRLLSPVEVTGNLKRETKMEGSIMCSVCNIEGAQVSCKGECGQHAYCSEDCNSRHWYLQGHGAVCKTK